MESRAVSYKSLGNLENSIHPYGWDRSLDSLPTLEMTSSRVIISFPFYMQKKPGRTLTTICILSDAYLTSHLWHLMH